MRNTRRTKLDEAKPRLDVPDEVAWRTRQIARDLRRRETESERILWDALRARRFHGLKFRRQQPIGPFVADFYCAELRCVVEIDGGLHDNHAQKLEDASRQQAIESIGIAVVRVHSEAVMTCLGDVLDQIGAVVSHLSPDSKLPSPPEGEGPGVRVPQC